MGKKFYVGIIGVFVLVSIGMGMISYQLLTKMEKITNQLDQFEWVIPMGTEYFAFGRNEEAENFTALDAETYEEKVFNPKGKVIATGAALNVYEDFYFYEEDSLQGVKDNEGNVLIPATFKSIGTFDGKYGQAMTKGDAEVVFDQKGEVIYRSPHNETSLWQLNDTLFGVTVNDTYKVFDIETGKTVFQSTEYSGTTYIGEGYYSAYTGEVFGDIRYKVLLDDHFEPVLKGQRFETISEFSQGYCYVEKVEGVIDKDRDREPATVNGYMDKSGHIKIKLDGNVFAGDFSEEKAIVYYRDKLHCIDKTGGVLFELPAKLGIQPNYGYPMFHRGKAAVLIGNKKGLINEKGEWIISPEFDELAIIARELVSIGNKKEHGVIRIGGEDHVD